MHGNHSNCMIPREAQPLYICVRRFSSSATVPPIKAPMAPVANIKEAVPPRGTLWRPLRHDVIGGASVTIKIYFKNRILCIRPKIPWVTSAGCAIHIHIPVRVNSCIAFRCLQGRFCFGAHCCVSIIPTSSRLIIAIRHCAILIPHQFSNIIILSSCVAGGD